MQSLGVETEDICQKLGIAQEDILDTDKTFTLDQFISVLDFAISETGDASYGLKMGKEPYLAGIVGMMCASCKNLKEAFIQGCKYFDIQGNFAQIEFIDDRDHPKIRYALAPSWTMHSPETARHEVDIMFSLLVSILHANSNHSLHPYRILLTSKKPESLLEYRDSLGIEPVFEQEANEMIFRSKDLLIPMKAFNPEAFHLLRSHIESQLKRFSSQTLLSEKVRAILLSSLRYRFPNIETVASRLNMSPRTLQRQLSNEQTNFKTLLQNTIFALAKQMLRQKDVTISEISFMLGYSDLGNFSRSFKKFTGYSPQEFRNQWPIKNI